MRFDAKLGIWILQGWTVADIHHRATGTAANLGEGRIDSFGWERLAGYVKVRGGETELLPQTIAADDRAGQRVSAPKHLAGRIHVSGSDSFPDACAADGFAVERYRRQAMDGEAQFCAELPEQLHIATAFMAEDEIRADTNALNGSEATRALLDEGLPGLFAECLIEVQE